MLTQDRLKELLDYNPETGVFTWKKRAANCVHIGTRAGCESKRGYRAIRIMKRHYAEHRLAWLWMKGNWPHQEMDHINGIKNDNRWSNLRPANDGENRCNTRKPKNNTSGIKGVYWEKVAKKWRAKLHHDKKFIHVGLFDDQKEAQQAIENVRIQFHKEFCKHE